MQGDHGLRIKKQNDNSAYEIFNYFYPNKCLQYADLANNPINTTISALNCISNSNIDYVKDIKFRDKKLRPW